MQHFVPSDYSAGFKPPAPTPRAKALGPIGLLRVLADNPLEAWTESHFSEPIVLGGLTMGTVAAITDPAAIRRVLMDNHENYQKDWLQRRVLAPALTGGLLITESRQWRAQRRTFAPLFARKSVMSFASAMVDAANEAVARLRAHDGQVVNVAEEVTRVTLDVLERTVFSDGLGRDREDLRLAMKVTFEAIGRIHPFDILGVPGFVPRPGLRKLRPTLQLFEDAIDTIIETRRARLARKDEDVPRDILTSLLDATDPDTGGRLPESEIRANILTFIAAGHETTSNCITWSLFLLSQSPEWRAKVQAEAEREFSGNIEELADRLVMTRAVIDEANRLYPPIAAMSRQALGPDTLAGQSIRRGTMVVIPVYVLHRHRAIWAAPDDFDPNRFLGAARERIDRFAYLPFGVGPRICIGATFALQEAAIVIATIMRHFTLAMAPGHQVWPVQKVTLRPRGGLPMIVRRR